MNRTLTKPKRLKNKNTFLLPPPRMLRRAGLIFLFIFLSSAFSCKEDPPVIPPPPPPDLRKLTLTFEDASCTEVWIKIKADSITLPAEIKLMQEADEQSITLTTTDTVFYIDSLTPNQTYYYQAVLNTDTTIKSETVTAQTLDTTSHNFTWQTFEFGQHSSSVFYDVAIIDENNIWAVGEIYMNDSLGNPDPTFYNAIHWDGIQWNPIRILYNGGIWSIKAVLAFSSNDIWFSAFVRYLNGQFVELPIPAILIGWNKNRIWGNSSSDLYVVGNDGNIAHYNGSQWTKIESGTTLHLTDVYGDANGNVYAAGVNIAEVKGVVLEGNTNQFTIKIAGEIIDESELFISKLYGSFGAIWVDENGTIYTGGNLMYQFKNNRWDYVRSLPENFLGGNPGSYYRGYISAIRGNGSNDIVIAGGRNTLKHFNGISWQQLGMPYSPSSVIRWAGLSMKDNKLVAAGGNGNKAFVMLLNR